MDAMVTPAGMDATIMCKGTVIVPTTDAPMVAAIIARATMGGAIRPMAAAVIRQGLVTAVDGTALSPPVEALRRAFIAHYWAR